MYIDPCGCTLPSMCQSLHLLPETTKQWSIICKVSRVHTCNPSIFFLVQPLGYICSSCLPYLLVDILFTCLFSQVSRELLEGKAISYPFSISSAWHMQKLNKNWWNMQNQNVDKRAYILNHWPNCWHRLWLCHVSTETFTSNLHAVRSLSIHPMWSDCLLYASYWGSYADGKHLSLYFSKISLCHESHSVYSEATLINITGFIW